MCPGGRLHNEAEMERVLGVSVESGAPHTHLWGCLQVMFTDTG